MGEWNTRTKARFETISFLTDVDLQDGDFKKTSAMLSKLAKESGGSFRQIVESRYEQELKRRAKLEQEQAKQRALPAGQPAEQPPSRY